VISPAARYAELRSERDPYLRRARDCAKLTIPALVPDEGSTSSTKFYSPHQSLGARGVNNLASKLLLALIPQQSSFFRLQIDEKALEELTGEEGKRGEIEEALARIERTALSALEASSIRTVGFEGFKQLLVAGNVLLAFSDAAEPRAFRLDKYVVRRAPDGTVLELIIAEQQNPEALDPEVAALLPEPAVPQKGRTRATVTLYTYICWDQYENHYKSCQYINDVAIPGTEGSYPKDKFPYLPLRFIRVDGEDYGRSYVEEYYGDLRSLEGLEKAILKGSAASAKVLYFVNPGGVTRLKDVVQSESGDVRSGNAADVTVLQTQKSTDLSVAKSQSETLQNRLAFAFLLNSAIQRGGERVTAEEVRYMARELEDALGGIYSILAQEFQRPLVTLLLEYLRKTKRIPNLPKGSVRPVIVTGLDALGRGQDLARLDEFLNGVPQVIAQSLAEYLNVGDYLTRRATALGLERKGLVRTQQEVDSERQRQQDAMMQQSVVDKAAGPVAQAAAAAAQAPQ